MNSGFAFALVILAIAVFTSVFRLGGFSVALDYLRDPKNKKIAAGIKMFAGAGIAIGIIFGLLLFSSNANGAEEERVEWFNYGEIFIGVDFPMKSGENSPQCVKQGPDSKTTSNGGIKANVIAYGRLEVNAKYQHHSCAFNEDVNLYDKVGIETTYRLW